MLVGHNLVTLPVNANLFSPNCAASDNVIVPLVPLLNKSNGVVLHLRLYKKHPVLTAYKLPDNTCPRVVPTLGCKIT